MSPASGRLILASGSPQRRRLINLVKGQRRIEVIPPDDPDEQGFSDLSEFNAIVDRLRSVTATKLENVVAQLLDQQEDLNSVLILAADTVIVAGNTDSGFKVLGKPPDQPDWRDTVRNWFLNDLAGTDHEAVTMVMMQNGSRDRRERISRTIVSFHADIVDQVEWYLATGESVGKAGGYALQGAGSLFVSSIRGSVSNVIGLPLEVVRDMLEDFSHVGQ